MATNPDERLRPSVTRRYGNGPDLPRLLAEVRHAALQEAVEVAEAFLHSEPGPGAAKDELDRIATYSNGTVRRIVAQLVELQKQPAAPKGAP